MGNVYEAFSFADTVASGKALGDLTVDYCKDVLGNAVSTTGMTLTELGAGDYVLMNPNITARTFCRVHLTIDATKRAVVCFDPIDGNIALDSTVAKDATVMKAASYVAPPTATDNADALLKRDLSAVTGEALRSPLNAIRKLMNRVRNSGTLLQVYKEDDTTVAYTQGVTENSSRNPISELDTN